MVHKISKEILIYVLLTMFLSAFLSISAYHLWGTDWRVPISGYRSDSLGVLLELSDYVKGGNGENSGFGDSSVPMLLLKLIWRATGSVEEAINIHAVLNSIFLSLSMFWVCTRLKIRNFFSMLSGVLYGNLSYFIVGANTVLLIYSFCFYIPLFCYILIELMRTDGEQNKLTLARNPFFVIVVMLFMGMNSAYYAFLAMILLAFATLYALIVVRRVDSILLAFFSYIAIGMGIASYTIPKILRGTGLAWIAQDMGYKLRGMIIIVSVLILWGFSILIKKFKGFLTLKWVYVGTIVFAGVAGAVYVVLWKYTDYIGAYGGRSLVDVQLGSLKIGAMVLPAVNSAFGMGRSILGAITDINDMRAGDIAEIGVLAGVGFVYSVIKVFQYEIQKTKDEVVRICGLMNCFIIVVATKGGLSLLVGAFITSGIRGYSKMCVYIATFGLISFAILVEKIFDWNKTISNTAVRKGGYLVTAAVLALGIMLSVPTDFKYRDMFGIPEYKQRKSEYDEWQRYVGSIETQMPEGGTILVFPLHPDEVYVGDLMTVGRAYELNIPEIVSTTLLWDRSGGGENGTVLGSILDKGYMEDFLKLMCILGYDGIYIDTMMYHDDSYVQLIEGITQQLGEPFICNENRRYFYSMKDYNRMLREQYTDEELEFIKEQIIEQY